MQNKNNIIKNLVIIGFILMVAVNILANTIPINNQTTGEVSDSYPNLFAPAGYTFSIWGLIYLLLGIYSFYQIKLNPKNYKYLNQLNIYFFISSIFNILWILSWHYNLIGPSTLFILLIFFSLYKINELIDVEDKGLFKEKFIFPAFRIYYGWITVASLANIVTFLVSIGFNGTNELANIIFLILGLVILIFLALKNKSPIYSLTGTWAYTGILYKHLTYFNLQYKYIVLTLIASILILLTFTFNSYRAKKLSI